MKNPVSWRLKESCCFIAGHSKGASPRSTGGSLEQSPPSDWDALKDEGLAECTGHWNLQVNSESGGRFGSYYTHRDQLCGGAELISAFVGGWRRWNCSNSGILKQVTSLYLHGHLQTPLWSSHISNTGLFYQHGSNPSSFNFKYEVSKAERFILDPS